MLLFPLSQSTLSICQAGSELLSDLLLNESSTAPGMQISMPPISLKKMTAFRSCLQALESKTKHNMSPNLCTKMLEQKVTFSIGLETGSIWWLVSVTCVWSRPT